MSYFLAGSSDVLDLVLAAFGVAGAAWAWFWRLRPIVLRWRKDRADKAVREKYVYSEIKKLSEAFSPNCNSSLYDKITNIEDAVHRTMAMTRAIIDLDPYDPVFETDASGGYVRMNRVWSQYTGLTAHQGLQNGWMLAVEEEDRTRVWAEWSDAIAQKREFDMSYRMRNAITGKATTVHVRAIPSRKPNGAIIGWMGVGQIAQHAR